MYEWINESSRPSIKNRERSEKRSTNEQGDAGQGINGEEMMKGG